MRVEGLGSSLRFGPQLARYGDLVVWVHTNATFGSAWGLGFGVWGLGFGVWGLGFGVWGLGFGV